MPAAAVIPAPRVYIKVVAVKKLVVGLGVDALWFLGVRFRGYNCMCFSVMGRKGSARLREGAVCLSGFTLKKLGCSKQTKSS